MSDHKESIGRYKIKSRLGEGAAGIVYKAFDPVLQRTVALKVPKLADNSIEKNIKAGQDFYTEAVMGGQFQHENIVTIYDVGRDNHVDYLVMEYVDGVSLKYFLKHNQPLDIDYVTESIFRLCLALDYIHFNEIVHRDIKPDNIMVSAENELVKLMDFSCASRVSDVASDKTGSAPYMAPEIHDVGNRVGIQSDIFSLGAVMYELLTGKMAFPGDDALACVYKVINEPPVSARKIREDIPDGLVEVLNKALEKNPENRYQSVLEFADALNALKQNNSTGTKKILLKEEQYLVFRKDAFFKNFSPDQVKELMDAGEVQVFEDKQVILNEGSENNTFFLVLQGEVRVIKGKQLIRKLGEGECFGEMSYLTGATTTASIVSKGDVMIWGVSPGLIEKMSCNSQLGFQKAFIEMIVQRLTKGTRDIAQLQEMLYKLKQEK
ncbi:MAG: protein kinase [Gammaproteobacteria bacterium]